MGLGDVLRRGMTEQHAGQQVQEVPVRNLMRIVSEGVGELVEANKAKSAVTMLKELIQTTEPDPLAGLKHLKEIGLDFGTVTGIHKEAAETYRNMVHEEREQRKEIAAMAEKAKEEIYEMRYKMLEMQVQQLMQSMEKSLEEIRKAITGNGAERKDNQITSTVQDAIAQIIQQAVAKTMNAQEKDPFEEMDKSLRFYDKLSEYLRLRFGGGGNDEARQRALLGDIKLDALKIILEDEREREHLREQREIERERIAANRAMWETIRDQLGNLVPALWETVQALRSGQPPQVVEQPAQAAAQQAAPPTAEPPKKVNAVAI